MTGFRQTWVDVDLDAIAHNVRALTFGDVEVMAVVKADAYGHGDVPVARAALAAGATWLGVALVEEGIRLRDAGVEAPILVLSEFPPGAEGSALAARLTPTVYSEEGVARLAAVAADAPGPVGVHVKVDTGMHRVGVWPPDRAAALVALVAGAGLVFDGLWTHLACADDDADATLRQLGAFDQALDLVHAAGHAPRIVHAANSAGAIGFPQARFDLIRPGIAVYGIEPSPGVGAGLGLRPALTWRSTVTFAKRLETGRRVSYGHHYRLEREAWIATVPVGYADGYPRLVSSRADVLIGGRRCRVAGSVTMDQLMVDCGEIEPTPGDEVVLLGGQGGESVTAWELATRSDTIAYEILARVGSRVPRRHAGDGGRP